MALLKIGNKTISDRGPVYIIAEIGSNFDGDFNRAEALAKLAKEAGADAFKIQNFLAPKIVSDHGFKNLQVSFQAAWDKPVTEVYRQAEFPRNWLGELAEYCRQLGIDFLSSPYDQEAVDLLAQLKVPAYKIGSGEIDNLELLKYTALKGLPIILATGASTLSEIKQAVEVIYQTGNRDLLLLQSVTNYPSPVEEANLLAMVSLKKQFKTLVGYSDHTIGFKGGGNDILDGLTVALGAVALGAVVIEKHFTDDRSRRGPDHPFAMEAGDFAKMVKAIRSMELALGDGVKKITAAEKETVIIQRRSVYAITEIKAGQKLTSAMVEYLRPALGLRPPEIKKILNLPAKRDISQGEVIKLEDFI